MKVEFQTWTYLKKKIVNKIILFLKYFIFMLAYVIFILEIFNAQVSLFFFSFFLFLFVLFPYITCLDPAKSSLSLNVRLRERKSDCCWRSKFPLIICFLNQLLISFLILIFYVYVLLQSIEDYCGLWFSSCSCFFPPFFCLF